MDLLKNHDTILRAMDFRLFFALSISLALLSVFDAHSATNLWQGGTGTQSWRVAGNWSLGIPNNTHDVVFPATLGAALTVQANGAITCLSLSIDSVTSLTLQSSNAAVRTLTIASGNITRNGSGNHLLNSTIRVTLGAAGTCTNTVAGTLTIAGPLSNGANLLTVTGNGDVSISGIIGAGAGGLTKNGTGVLTLSRANTYTGATTVNAGTVVVAANSPSGASGALGNSASNVLVGNTSGTTDASLLIEGAFTIGRLITVRSGSSGVVTLGGNTAAVSIFSNTITLLMNVALTAAGGGSVTISGLLNDGAGSFGVTKNGNGTVSLNRAAGNTYDGVTTIAAGRLDATNTSVSATGTGVVAISSGATLGGTGIISNMVTVASGGTVSPGLLTSMGILTVGSADFSAGGILKIRASGTGPLTVGTGFDQLNLGTGAGNVLTLGGAASTLSLNLTGLTAPATASGIVVFGARPGGNAFTLVDNPTIIGVNVTYAATTVDLSLSALGIIGITWAAGTTAKSEGDVSAYAWNLGAANLLDDRMTHSTSSTGGGTDKLNDFVVRNTGNTNETLTVSCGNSAAWTLAAVTGSNQFEVGVNTDDSAVYNSVVGGKVIKSGLSVNNTQSFDLGFKVPTDTSTGAVQNIKVTVTATAP